MAKSEKASTGTMSDEEEEVTRPPKIGKDPKSKGIKKDKDSCSLSVAS